MRFVLHEYSLYEGLDSFYDPVCNRLSLALYGEQFHSTFNCLQATACMAGTATRLCREEKKTFKRLPRVELLKHQGKLQFNFLSDLSIEEVGDKATLKIFNSTRAEIQRHLLSLRQMSPKLKEQLYSANATLYSHANDIVIAVVLAEIKLKGKTSSDLAKLGVAACTRMTRPFVEASILPGLWNQFSENYAKVQHIFKQFV